MNKLFEDYKTIKKLKIIIFDETQYKWEFEYLVINDNINPKNYSIKYANERWLFKDFKHFCNSNKVIVEYYTRIINYNRNFKEYSDINILHFMKDLESLIDCIIKHDYLQKQLPLSADIKTIVSSYCTNELKYVVGMSGVKVIVLDI